MVGSRKILLLFTVLLCWSSCAFAQPDSTGKNQFDLAIKIDGTDEVVTVIRDAMDPNQWFYVPSRPRLVVRDKEPVFAMVKYQAADPRNRSKLCQGAMVQFSVTMSLPATAISQITSKIEGKLPAGSKVKLTALPFNECKIDMLKPDGEFLAESGEAKSITTTFGSSEVPFQVKLNELGTDVYENLIRGNTGLPVIVTYKYPAWTPETAVTAELDYDMVFKSVSSDLDMQAQIGYAGSGISGGYNEKKVRELMDGKKGIKLSVNLADERDQEFVDKIQSSVLDKLYTELFDGPKFPEDFKTDPAVAKAPEILPTTRQTEEAIEEATKPAESASSTANASDTAKPADKAGSNPLGGLGKLLGGVNKAMNSGQLAGTLKIGYAMKDVKRVRKGKTSIDFRKRRLVEKTGGCGSFVGVGPFIKKNPDLEKTLIRDVITGGWENAEFILPKVTGLQELNVQTVALTVSIVDKTKKQVEPEGKAQAVVFDPAKEDLGWSKDGQSQEKLNFPLRAMIAKYSKDKVYKEYQYKVVASIQVTKPMGGAETIQLTQYQPLITGDIAMSTPMQFLNTLQIDASSIDWDEAKLTGVNINLKATWTTEGRQTSKNLQATITKAKKDNPITLQIPVSDDGNPATVTGKIEYKVNTKPQKSINSANCDLPNIVEAGPTVFLSQEWDEEGNKI